MARNLLRIAVVVSLALLDGAALAQPRADAQNYPARPIRIVVPNTAGSGMDSVTRMIGQRLTETWGQQVIVDNRPGAAGIIGHEIAAKSAPDGYTLLLAASAGVVINPLPTVAETLPDFRAVTWYALYCPRATPPAIVARLNAEVVKMLADPVLAQRLTSQGLDPAPGTPAELTAYMRAETERFSKIIKAAGLAASQ